MNRWIVLLAGLVGAVGVGLAAYAAHGLEAQLTAQGLPAELVARRLNTCDIAVRYHLIHAVALLGLAVAPNHWARWQRGLAALLFLVGLALFCGILYAQALAGLKSLHQVVPLGGMSFIVGWLALAMASLSRLEPSAP